MDNILETVIRVDVEETPRLRLVENVATGAYAGKPVELNRSPDSSQHFIVYEGKVYVLDMMNIMNAVLDQQYNDRKRGRKEVA